MSDYALREAVRELSGFSDLQENSYACKVSDIDTSKYTCTCSPIDGSADYVGVKYNADAKKGFVLEPKDNSIVIITVTSETTAFVSMVSEVNQIYLNGDGFDGLVKVGDLTTKLNNLENAFNQHLTLYNAHTHAGVTVGVGTSTQPVIPDTQTLTPTQQSQIENTKVKHG